MRQYLALRIKCIGISSRRRIPGNGSAAALIRLAGAFALVSLLVWREVRRAEAGPASEPAPRRADLLIVPLLALFVIVVVLELVRML